MGFSQQIYLSELLRLSSPEILYIDEGKLAINYIILDYMYGNNKFHMFYEFVTMNFNKIPSDFLKRFYLNFFFWTFLKCPF